jgi:ABC-2 type transport system permease protein
VKKELNAIATIAARDFTKFIRDRVRILATFMFPIIFIGILGGSLQSNLGKQVEYNFLTFVFIGVVGQTLFQSTAAGIISLIRDRESDFSQEMFVSPISRFSIIVGKIIGESTVSLAQVIGTVIFAFVVGVPIHFGSLLLVIPATLIVCLLGGAFGILVLANLSNQMAANQIFPFVIFPQIFLSGVFSPIKELPPVLFFLSRITPMTYGVDFIRGIYYWGTPEYSKIVLHNPLVNLLAIIALFTVFLSIGTFLFIRNERNR